MIRSKHIQPARRVFLPLARFWCTREKGADCSQDDGCPVNTNRLPQGKTNQNILKNVESESNRAFTINQKWDEVYCSLSSYGCSAYLPLSLFLSPFQPPRLNTRLLCVLNCSNGLKMLLETMFGPMLYISFPSYIMALFFKKKKKQMRYFCG